MGNQSLSNENFEQSLEIFELIEELYPDSEWGYIGQGSAYYSLKNYRKSKIYFQKVISINPYNSYATDMLNAIDKKIIEDQPPEKLT